MSRRGGPSGRGGAAPDGGAGPDGHAGPDGGAGHDGRRALRGTGKLSDLPAQAPPGYREEVLARMPSLGALYARAVGRTRTLVLSSAPLARSGLPKVVLRVDGVTATAEQLSDYQHLVGEPGTDVLPAGYVHVLAFPLAMALMVRPDFPLQVLGMVHVANRVEQHRALRLGEAFTVRAWAQDAREHARGTEVDLVVTVSTAPGTGTGVGLGGVGEELWRGVSTYLAKGRRPRDLEVGGSAPPAPDERPAATSPDDRAARAPDERSAAPAALWHLPADAGRAYAAVSGDRNPIHVSRLGARLFGFRRPIAHGMYTAALALAATARDRGEAFVWTVHFVRPVLLPATVAFAAERTGKGVRYTAWSPRSGKPHLGGTVTPL
ncbi:MaoC/PaaZ C-terminal domain-containing protein [Georgenia sp. SYP-B2076]|uniref:MaoC/PaaZ C-terminal domain-containing protein n=1 Tax=Georgenia sp. SYP-B2076 TaxID=2495881 RepID=UPI001F0C2BBD|nr:MaoC/PaaZ C-terminal domain-containing protein [Georgenia sp. SYP-B2076]